MLLVCASLAWTTGCKPVPPVHVDTFEPFVLLDPGREPRQKVRYAIAPGTSTRSTMTVAVETTGAESATRFVLGLRDAEIDFQAGPAEPTKEGIGFPFQVADVRPRGSTSHDGDWASSIVGAGAIVEIDTRGNVVWSESNLVAADMSPRTRAALVATGFELTRIALPKADIGVGARWKVRSRVAIMNFTTLQELTYTWVETVDGKMVIDIEYAEDGALQHVDFVGTRAAIESESLHMTGRGRILLDPHALLSEATFAGVAAEQLVLEEGESSTRVTVEETLEVSIRTTTPR